MFRGRLFLPACAAAAAVCGSAQAQTIGTVAGGGNPGSAATAYSAPASTAVAVDASGNLYVAVSGLNQVWIVSPGGAVTEVIGNGPGTYNGGIGPGAKPGLTSTASGYSGDGGPATNAGLSAPSGVALDSTGNLYIADQGNNVIRQVAAATGIISTVAGNVANGMYSYTGDGGPATSAGLNHPIGVAVDSIGNLYIADSDNNVIRKVTAATGIISTIVGTGAPVVFNADGDGGPAASAELSEPYGIALDSIGNLYIADDTRIRMVAAATGIINTVAGNGVFGYSGDGGQAVAAQLNFATGVAVDSEGNLYIADQANSAIRQVTAATGIIGTVVGNGVFGYSGDGRPAISAQLNEPYGVAVDSSGNLYIADTDNNVIRKVTAATGTISTFAGNGISNSLLPVGDGGPAASAQLNQPHGVAFDSSGNLYIAEGGRIRKVAAATGMIGTVAGTYSGFGVNYSGDGGPATSARLYDPEGVAVDSSGNIYIADTYNSVIRKVTAATGIIGTVAGNGSFSYGGDGGPAANAQLHEPTGVAVDSTGNLYIADQGNNVIRKVAAATGIISTVAGTATHGYSGDGGPAASAQLYEPSGVAVDAAGDLYIADQGNQVIRKVTAATGIVSTVAGDGGAYGFSGDGGPAAGAELADPFGVAVSSSGRIYVADTLNNRIRAVPGPAAANPRPVVSPSFAGGSSVPVGATTILSFPITNTDPEHAANGVGFSSALSFGLVVATPNGLSGSCGTVAAVSGGRGMTASGVDLAPGATCTFAVSVAAVTAGVQYSTVADLVSGGQPANWFTLADITVKGSAAVSNGASFGQGAVVPNGILAYFGPVGCLPNEQVLVNGAAASILFANAAQINFVSPASIAGSFASIQVVCNGSAAVTLTVPAAAVNPSLFTQTGTGTGQGSIVNADGTINSAANPIAQGSYISAYGTGFGSLNPAGADGLQHLAATVTATIGGANANVTYAGQAPGETPGLQQINIQVPTGITPGPGVAIVLAASGMSTQAGVTVAVK